MLLRKAILEYCVVHKFETVSLRYYKEFEAQGEIDPAKRLSKFQIPNYLQFSHLLFSCEGEELILGFKSLINKGYDILTKGSNLECLDFISVLMVIIHKEEHQKNVLALFSNDDFLELFRCVSYIKNVLRKLAGRNVLNIIEAVLSIHQSYRISYCKSMTFVNDTFTFVNRTSTIANELVENSKANSFNFAYFF